MSWSKATELDWEHPLAPEGWPAMTLDLCLACYEDAADSGMLDWPAA